MSERDLMRVFWLIILIALALAVYVFGTVVGWWS